MSLNFIFEYFAFEILGLWWAAVTGFELYADMNTCLWHDEST